MVPCGLDAGLVSAPCSPAWHLLLLDMWNKWQDWEKFEPVLDGGVEGRDGRWHSTRAAAARGRDHSQSHHYTQELTCHCDLYSDSFSHKARPDTLFFLICCSSIWSKICNSTFEYCFQAWVELTQLELIGFCVTVCTSQLLKPMWQLRQLSMLPWK
jgi:hypothetical protein